MKLLTPGTGWVSNDNHLYWTTDSGSHWTDITPVPPGVARAGVSIRSTYFLNTQEGWVVISHPQQVVPLTLKALRTRKTLYDIAQTVDGGETWSFLPLNYPALSPDEQAGLTGPGDMFFLDSLHGWLVMGFDGNSDPGRLLVTDDGGRNWIWEHGVGFSGIIRFTSMKDGWFLGGPYKQLFATHDGGKAWEEVKLAAPPQAGAATEATYEGLPVFDGPRHGFTAVFFIGPPGVQPKFVVYSTDDGGKAWRPVKVLGESEESGALTPIPFSIADSLLIISKEGSPNSTTLARVDLGGDLESTTEFSTKGPLQLSFLDETHGLALGRGGSLLGTSDGGRTWRNVTPWHAPHPSPLPPGITVRHPKIEIEVTHPGASKLLSPLAPSGGGPSKLHTSVHLGFDTTRVMTVSQMQNWWNESPYYDEYIYLNKSAGVGSPNRGYDGTLGTTASQWVSPVESQGWGLVPIWFGLQPDCLIEGDPAITQFIQPANAAQEGKDGADAAADAADALGLSGTIIYKDMENYYTDSTHAACRDAAKTYISSWDSELAARGYTAGVYANPLPIKIDIGYVSPPPNDIWIAHYDKKATIFDPTAGWESLRPAGKRSRQYFLQTNESYGNSYGIDRDIEDAPVAGGSGNKVYTYPGGNFKDLGVNNTMEGINDAYQGQQGKLGQITGFTHMPVTNGTNSPFIYDNGVYNPFGGCPSSNCALQSINNVGDAVGSYGDASGGHGFFYDHATQTALPIVYQPGSFSTVPLGVNDDDQIVGWYEDGSTVDGQVVEYGYVDDGGSFSSINNSSKITQAYGINGFGQVVGLFIGSRGKYHGFVSQNGQPPAQIDCKRASYTAVFAINNNQQISGECFQNGYSVGFVYDLVTGSIVTTFSFGGQGSSVATRGAHINDSAQISGFWRLVSSYEPSGFYATPSPSP